MSNPTQLQSKRRRWPWLIAGICLLLIAAAVVLPSLGGGSETAAAQTPDIVTVGRGEISANATASGAVVTHREAALSLGVSGIVDRVLVQVGDSVSEGQPLVQLRAGALARQVASAEQNLIIQQANLDELRSGSSAADIASAQAAIESAQANLAKVKEGPNAAEIAAAGASLNAAQSAYADLKAGPDADSLAQAEATRKNAEAALRQAQAAYDKVAWRSDIGRLPEALELEQTTNSYNAALASYNLAAEGAAPDQLEQARATVEQARASLQKLLDSPTAADLAASESQLAQAEAQLASIANGATAEKLAIAEAQVEQARINLEEAQDNLARATLTAPFAGVVTAVYVAEGEQANGPAVELADTARIEVVLDIDEIDLGELAIGQPALVTLEAWPREEIPAKVTAIAPKASSSAGATVSYETRLELGSTDLPVRLGMTANADLTTAAREGVLLAPSRAITSDRAAGKYYADVVRGESDGQVTTQRVEVSIGLRDGLFTEIKSGLSEGDRLLIPAAAETEAPQTSSLLPQPGNNPLRGLGR